MYVSIDLDILSSGMFPNCTWLLLQLKKIAKDRETEAERERERKRETWKATTLENFSLRSDVNRRQMRDEKSEVIVKTCRTTSQCV